MLSKDDPVDMRTRLFILSVKSWCKVFCLVHEQKILTKPRKKMRYENGFIAKENVVQVIEVGCDYVKKSDIKQQNPEFRGFYDEIHLIVYSLTLMMFMYFMGTLNSAPSSLTMHFSESVSPVITPFLYPVTSFH